MRECPLLVSDCAVRDQLKRVKVLKKKNKKKNSQTNKQKKKRNKNPGIQIFLVFPLFVFISSLAGRELAWQFVEDNWDELYTRYAGGLLFSRLIKVTCHRKTAWKKTIGGMNKTFSLSRPATLRRFRCRKANLYVCLLFLDDHRFVLN